MSKSVAQWEILQVFDGTYYGGEVISMIISPHGSKNKNHGDIKVVSKISEFLEEGWEPTGSSSDDASGKIRYHFKRIHNACDLCRKEDSN